MVACADSRSYALQWLVVLPLEIVAATYTISFWNHGSVNNNAWVAVFLTLIVGINLFGVKGYGEAEFVFAIIKVAAVVGFVILGIIINIGGGPNGEYIGFKYWRDPGAFNNGFKGFCGTFVNAAFAFSDKDIAVRWIQLGEFELAAEPGADRSDLRIEHAGEAVLPDGLQALHAIDAAREHGGVVQRLPHRRSWRGDRSP